MRSAEESRQIAKARRKLKKRLEVIDRQFTQTALQEVVERMHSLLEQQETSQARGGKRVAHTTFDKNTHSAQVSQSIHRLREQLMQRLQQEHEDATSLSGRVTRR